MTKFEKQHPELPGMQISLATRGLCMEVCFGDPSNEKPNIAASILRSLLKLKPDLRAIAS